MGQVKHLEDLQALNGGLEMIDDAFRCQLGSRIVREPLKIQPSPTTAIEDKRLNCALG